MERDISNSGAKPVRVVGSVRCSTDEQAASDFNTLENQTEFISQLLAVREPDGWRLILVC
ncbi:MAG: hypothetical protein AMXMBFR61_05510 [Fimbriimonadales bacterium]